RPRERGSARHRRRADVPQPRRGARARRREHDHRAPVPDHRRPARRARAGRRSRRRAPHRHHRDIARVAHRVGVVRGRAAVTPPPVVWFVVPKGIDDPARVSGGNVYDREVRDGLRDRGWTVSIVECADAAGVASALRSASDATLLHIDGLAAGWAAPEVEAATGRLRIVVLAHMLVAAFPDATASEIEAETRMLRHARRVIVTGRWTGEEVARRGLADAERITVARPGVRA